ncbi:hypothetical protein IAT38_004858 [Cryptococcus sp. DSM 104549]
MPLTPYMIPIAPSSPSPTRPTRPLPPNGPPVYSPPQPSPTPQQSRQYQHMNGLSIQLPDDHASHGDARPGERQTVGGAETNGHGHGAGTASRYNHPSENGHALNHLHHIGRNLPQVRPRHAPPRIPTVPMPGTEVWSSRFGFEMFSWEESDDEEGGTEGWWDRDVATRRGQKVKMLVDADRERRARMDRMSEVSESVWAGQEGREADAATGYTVEMLQPAATSEETAVSSQDEHSTVEATGPRDRPSLTNILGSFTRMATEWVGEATKRRLSMDQNQSPSKKSKGDGKK